MDNSLIVEGLNIAELNDDELGERLQSLGFNPGPILATTRTVYQRKLARLLRNEEFFPEDENCDAEVRPSPVLHSTMLDYSPSTSFNSGSPQSSVGASPITSFNFDDLRRRPLNRDGGLYSSPKPWSPDDIVSQAPPPPLEPEKPLFSSATKIVMLVIVLTFFALVYYNMEATPVNPFTAPPPPPDAMP